MKKIFAVLTALIMLISVAGCNSEKGFENTEWGMTVAEVNEVTERTLHTDASGNVFTNEPGEVDGIPSEIVKVESIQYCFGEDKGLSEVVLDTVPADRSNFDTTMQALKKHYDGIYTFRKLDGNSYIWDTDFGSVTVSPFNSVIKIGFSQK